ncbi:MAG: hypothetical protein ABI270_05175 [Nitrosospira sp.]
MKKPSSFAQQIQRAQRTIEGWPDGRKSTIRLEGFDVFLTQQPLDKQSHQLANLSSQKKKANP